MLIFIEGGPEIFAGKAFETSSDLANGVQSILDHPEFNVQEYRYTSRTIKSARFPEKVAQVWRHVSVPDDTPPPGTTPTPSAVDDPHAMAAEETVREGETEAIQVASSPGVVSTTSESPELDYTGPPVEVGDDGDLPSGEQLFLRRKKLKISVQDASDATGLATSKIAAIEKGTGKRIKPGEVQALVNFLSQREIDSGQRGAIQAQSGGGAETPRE